MQLVDDMTELIKVLGADTMTVPQIESLRARLTSGAYTCVDDRCKVNMTTVPTWITAYDGEPYPGCRDHVEEFSIVMLERRLTVLLTDLFKALDRLKEERRREEERQRQAVADTMRRVRHYLFITQPRGVPNKWRREEDVPDAEVKSKLKFLVQQGAIKQVA